MKTYKSHKTVRASQVKTIEQMFTDDPVKPDHFLIGLESGTKLVARPGDDIIARYMPRVGDYFLQYEDGHLSFSPQHAFETGYRLVPADDMDAELRRKGKIAPRITVADIEGLIVDETFTILPSGKVMVCELTLASGFSVRGEAAVVSIENFDMEIGQRISRENAKREIWQLEGYRLQCELATRSA